MSKLIKVTLEYDDHIAYIDDEEEVKIWDDNCRSLSVMASIRSGNQNPFDHRPTIWKTIQKPLNKTSELY